MMARMMTWLRGVLHRPVRVDAIIEAAFWLAIPYLLVGLVLAFAQPDNVTQVQRQLQARVPQSSEFDLVALGLATALWPAMLVAPVDCPP